VGRGKPGPYSPRVFQNEREPLSGLPETIGRDHLGIGVAGGRNPPLGAGIWPWTIIS